MRPRVIVPIVVLIVVVATGSFVLSRRGEDGPSASGRLPSRTVAAGGVDVIIVPVRIDDSGAVFRVSLDTHSGDLAVDLAETARLEVNGTEWGNPVWNGDPPGGHHRQGELSFTSGGSAQGSVRLTIGGLPGPVVADWTLPAA